KIRSATRTLRLATARACAPPSIARRLRQNGAMSRLPSSTTTASTCTTLINQSQLIVSPLCLERLHPVRPHSRCHFSDYTLLHIRVRAVQAHVRACERAHDPPGVWGAHGACRGETERAPRNPGSGPLGYTHSPHLWPHTAVAISRIILYNVGNGEYRSWPR